MAAGSGYPLQRLRRFHCYPSRDKPTPNPCLCKTHPQPLPSTNGGEARWARIIVVAPPLPLKKGGDGGGFGERRREGTGEGLENTQKSLPQETGEGFFSMRLGSFSLCLVCCSWANTWVRPYLGSSGSGVEFSVSGRRVRLKNPFICSTLPSAFGARMLMR